MSNKTRLLINQVVLILAMCCGFISLSAAKDFDDRVIKHIDYPKWFKDSPFLELSDDLKKARANGKKGLMLVFGTEGCSYCARFIRLSLGDPKIAALVQKNFDSIGMEIFNDADITSPSGKALSAKQFAKDEGVQFSPSVIFYGAEGKQILRLVGYQSPERFKKVLAYVGSDIHKTESFSHFLKRLAVMDSPIQVNAGLKSDPLFSKPPYILESGYRSSKKPLLIIFEKTACKECEYFHTAVLALKEVRDMMKKFDVIRLDASDVKTPILAPNGKRITSTEWYEQNKFTRVPAIVLFTEKGKEVLKTDALVMRLRMVNSMKYVTEKAYEKGWTFQRFGREKGRAKAREKLKNKPVAVF